MKEVKSRQPIKKTPSHAKANETQNEKIVNLTGEPITILIDNQEKTIPPEKEVASVTWKTFPPREIDEINKIKVIKRGILETTSPITKNLPPPTDNTMYIVPQEVARNEVDRSDVFCVDPNKKNYLIQYDGRIALPKLI